MTDFIRRALAWVLLFVLPGTGRHRAGDALPPAPALARGRTPISPYAMEVDVPLDGAASALVRPYVRPSVRPSVLHRRRLALVLAADYGIDLDRHIRGAAA